MAVSKDGYLVAWKAFPWVDWKVEKWDEYLDLQKVESSVEDLADQWVLQLGN